VNEAPLGDSLRDLLARYPGVRSCAVVDASSGLVWQRHPDTDMDGLWEASVDHWRLHHRLGSHFDALGALGAIVTYHREATLAIIPCLREPDVLLVCLADHRGVDWVQWQRDARGLGARIRATL
jgi:hypothetical protein